MIACEIKRKHALVYMIFFEMTVSIIKINFLSMFCSFFWWISFIVPKSLRIYLCRPEVFLYLFATVLNALWNSIEMTTSSYSHRSQPIYWLRCHITTRQQVCNRLIGYYMLGTLVINKRFQNRFIPLQSQEYW